MFCHQEMSQNFSILIFGLYIILVLFVFLFLSRFKKEMKISEELDKKIEESFKRRDEVIKELNELHERAQRSLSNKDGNISDGTLINSLYADKTSVDYLRFVFDYCSIGILRIDASTLKRERFNPVMKVYFSSLTGLNNINIFEVVDYIIVDKMCEVFKEEISDKKRESVNSYKFVKFKELDKFAKVTMVAEVDTKTDTFSYYNFFIHDISDMIGIIEGTEKYVEVSCLIKPELYEKLKKMNSKFEEVSLF